MQASLQGKDNVIRQLKKQLSQLQVTRSDTDHTLKVWTTDSHITKLTDQVTNLQAQNDLFRTEIDKIKQHYKELYDSTKITRAKHIEQVTKLTTDNVNLKTSVSKDKVKPQVLAREKYAIDVEPIVHRLRNNKDADVDYLRHLKERVNSCPNASRSQPKRNVNLNRISPAKGVNKIPVEDQPRTNKSPLRSSNRVDSSSRLKRTVIDSNSNSICQTCNKCLTSSNHDMYVATYLQSVVALPSIRYNHNVVRKVTQNSVVEKRNRTLVEAARTMLIFSKAPMFLWAETVATVCYTQNHSLIHTRHHKTPYKLVHNKKPDLTFFRVFGALCYPTNDTEDLGKLQPTADIGIFVSYAPSRKGYRIYNKRTRRIMETIHVQFNKLTEQMASVHLGTGPAPNFLTPGQLSSSLVPNPVPATPYTPPTNKELKILFQPMFDEYMEPPRVERPVLPTQAVQAPVNSAGTPSSATIDKDAPSPNKMADVNAPSGQAPAMAPPVRTDDQILARIRWVPIGKSNCYLDLEKSQGNPIYKIAVDLFWDTIQYDKTAGCYRCQLDEQWFVLTKDTLREALQITPVNNNQAFVTPPSSDALINFVNELGYHKLVRNVSNVVTNDMFQPWRALITIINLCLTGKTSGFERPMAPNLSRHTTGKKKATLIVIPSIRFTKLIIHHLQGRHKFHPRPGSSLHLPNEEPVLGYLKFSAKGTKREVFKMPIPGSLITINIQEAFYYQEYLENVAKHRRYLVGETGSNQESPAPKPTKPDRKPKSTAPPRPSVSIPVTSAQPAPTSALAKPQENKHKQPTEISNKPPKSKKSKYGFISKKRSLKSVAASVAEDVPAMEPQVSIEDADLQNPLEESMKTMYAPPRSPLPQLVIGNLSQENINRSQRCQERAKQRSTFTTTGSSRQDEPSYAELEQSESEETKKVVLGADEGGQGESEGQAGPDPGAQAESQTGSDASTQDEGQARSNPDEISEGQAGPDRGNAGAEVQSIPSPVVHAGSDREHIDLDVADVLLEDPASSSGTLSSPQHLSKDISFGDLFFSDKPSEADNDKATAETKIKSMVSVTIQQDMSSIPPMTSPIIDLTSRPESPKVSKAVSEVVTHVVDWAMQAPLRNCFRDLPEVNMKEILHQRIWESESYKSHKDHMQLFEAFKNLMNCDHSEELAQDLAEARKKKKKSRESPKMPPGSPPHQPPPLPSPAGP
nr:integrase, catalytic region, zinc finger, CCHC-type, peptidase aspartic, catalytic [Tanacetum cinerariifolium]